MDHLVDEHRRQGDGLGSDDGEIGALDGAGFGKPVAEAQHDAVVVTGVRVLDRLQTRLVDRHERIGHDGLEQGNLVGAGFVDRVDFGPGEIGAQEVRRDRQLAVRIDLEQTETGRFPEITHRLRPRPRPGRAGVRMAG